MERKRPTDKRSDTQSGPGKEIRDGVELAQRARKALDPFSIPEDQLAKDPFLGEESVEKHLQRQKQE